MNAETTKATADIVDDMTRIANERGYSLPKEFGDKWLEALRSGEYKQCRSALTDLKGYCCLGVACKIAGLEDDDMLDEDYITNAVKDKARIAGVPEELIGDLHLPTQLADLNDVCNFSFKQIADWVEDNIIFYGPEEELSVTESIR